MERKKSLLDVLILFAIACTIFAFKTSCVFPEEVKHAGCAENALSGERVPLEITLGDAILMSLENNRALRIERLSPSIRKTYEQQEQAVFDPEVSAGISASRERSTETGDITDGDAGVSMGIGRFLPTGTGISAGISADRDWSDLYSDRHATRAGLTVTQALLQGGGIDFNLAGIRQAKLDTLSSEYELRGFAENLVAEVETAYWNYALAGRRIEIYRRSLELAEKQIKETEDRISAGTLAEIELAAALAEAALRKEALINAVSDMESMRLKLLNLINPGPGGAWNMAVKLKNLPAVPDVELDGVDVHSAVALKMRPDINQARLNVQRGDLDVVKTKNGLLPRMDFFISLGKTGYADSFGGSVEDIGGKSYDVSAGISFQWPVGNRDAESRHRRAVLSRRQADEALENFCQLAELDVRLAFIRVNLAYQQITATAATLNLQEEKLRAETEKFRVGRSTAMLVATAQRDLLAAQISEIQAVVSHLNSLVDLFRLEGSLLERRGLSTGSFQ